MIIIRNDDVLLASGDQFANAFERFIEVHEIIQKCSRMLHVPALVIKDLQQFPEAVDFIKKETRADRMRPQLHGMVHEDYGQMPIETVIAHLAEGRGWFLSNLGYIPTKWYTPWGANQPHLYEAAKPLGMEVIDCNNVIKFKGRYGVTQLIQEGRSADHFDDKEIIMHWWNALDVERLGYFVKYINEAHPTH